MIANSKIFVSSFKILFGRTGDDSSGKDEDLFR